MKIYFESYGCTLNSGEGKKMMEAARARGHYVTGNVDESELVVLLTCTVIEPTELKMQKRIRELNDTGKKLAVAGCMAAVQNDRITGLAPGAVLIPTPGQVEGFSKYLKDLGAEAGNGHDGSPAQQHLNDVSTPVPIAEGCLGKCAYCITRLARGELRSYPVEDILSDVRLSVESGAREIRLTAQDSAIYGLDKKDDLKLDHLLRDIFSMDIPLDDEEKYMVRLGMMNPNSLKPILDDLIETYLNPGLFKFLHLPVQSGSNRVLERMGRNYEVEEFENIVERFRGSFPELTLSTDMIVGFPGEEQEDHDASMGLLKKVRPNIVNITRYSERPGTPSIKMDGKLHGRITKERSREMTKLCHDISLEANKKYVDETHKMLATESDIGKHKETTMGRLDNYRPVVVDEKIPLGYVYNVKITSATEAYLIGDVIFR